MFTTKLLYFYIYGFIGWLIEFIYRFFRTKKIVNPGILYGPFLPMYSISGITIVILNNLISSLPVVIIICTILITIFEYFVSFITEKVFKIKLWDYSHIKFNVNGRISLMYSVFWAILIYLFLIYIHPYISSNIETLQDQQKLIITMLITGFLIYDILFSFAMLLNIRNIIIEFNEKFSKHVHLDKYFKLRIKRLSRLMKSYPNISRIINYRINSIKKAINDNTYNEK